MTMTSLVHAFSTFDGYYIYDTNTSSILKVPKGVHDNFKSGVSIELSPEDKRIIESLKESGFLKKSNIVKIEHPYSSRLRSLLERRVGSITLQVTQRCNLRCRYCVYSGSYNTRTHSNSSMSFEVARKSVDFLISHSVDTDNVNIGFYGGEPLLEFDLIKSTVKYARSVGEGKKIRFGMTTNGTVFTDEILGYLEENGFNLLLSLDGPKEVHDKNRVFAHDGRGTFDIIMDQVSHIRDDFPELYKNIAFNAVIDPRLEASCSNTFFINCEEFENANVAGNIIGDVYRKKQAKIPEKFLIKYEEEYFKVLMSKLGVVSDRSISKLVYFKFENLLGSLFVLRNKTRSISPHNHPSGPCIPGCRKLFIDVNGNFFPCENASESSSTMVIGNIDEGFDIEAARRILNIGQISENQCKNCWAFRLCSQCAIFADDGFCLSRKHRLARCADDKHGFEEDLKDYCLLIELGFEFQAEINKVRYPRGIDE